MFCGDYARETLVGYTMQQFHNCLRGPLHQVLGEVADEGSDNPVVDVRGQLWGGNLAMLVSLLGTPYFAAQPDGILFLEDISEHPYRIERMLLQLFYAGALAASRRWCSVISPVTS
jgi:muramoyltetrapeptide carboxypeptidase